MFFVIGVGLPRTGTLSTKAALEILLPGKCMHMFEAIENIDRVLNELLYNDINDENFRKFFEKYNYVAGVDVPFILKYQQAMRVFPDAVVLLTVREPEGWVRSMKNTVCKVHGDTILITNFPYYLFYWIYPSLKRLLHGYLDNNPTFRNAIESVKGNNGVEFYEKYIDDIKTSVPPERLLVFNVKEGWKPLCDALKLPVPTQPFPNVNDSKDFDFYVITKRKVISWGVVVVAVLTPIAAGYGLKIYYDLRFP